MWLLSTSTSFFLIIFYAFFKISHTPFVQNTQKTKNSILNSLNVHILLCLYFLLYMMTYFHKAILIVALEVAQWTCYGADRAMATMVVKFGLTQVSTTNLLLKKDKQHCPPCSIPVEFKQDHSYKEFSNN